MGPIISLYYTFSLRISAAEKNEFQTIPEFPAKINSPICLVPAADQGWPCSKPIFAILALKCNLLGEKDGLYMLVLLASPRWR